MYYRGAPEFEFGTGLSFTTFTFEWLSRASAAGSVDARAWASGAVNVSYAVKVTNTGGVVSDVSALAFVSTGVAGAPLKQLFDFNKAAALPPAALLAAL